jgi:hypothetical protein
MGQDFTIIYLQCRHLVLFWCRNTIDNLAPCGTFCCLVANSGQMLAMFLEAGGHGVFVEPLSDKAIGRAQADRA